MKPSEWIKKLEIKISLYRDKDMGKKSFFAMSEEEVKKLDEKFIDREEYEEVFRGMQITKKSMPGGYCYLIKEEDWKKFIKKLGLE